MFVLLGKVLQRNRTSRMRVHKERESFQGIGSHFEGGWQVLNLQVGQETGRADATA